MSEVKQFKLPDVGEGLTEADIVKWHVQPGDPVTINQVIVEIETAKAVVELPSPFEGVVTDLLAAEGATVDVGTPIISVSTGEGAGESAPAGAAPAEAAAPGRLRRRPRPPHLPGRPRRPAPRHPPRRPRSPLPGRPRSRPRRPPTRGPTPPRCRPPTRWRGRRSPAPRGAPGGAGRVRGEAGPTKRRQRKQTAAGPTARRSGARPAAAARQAAVEPLPRPAGTGRTAPAGRTGRRGRSARLAKPPVRKLAKDLGVDLGALTGSGPQGTITREDVQEAVGRRPAARGQPRRAGRGRVAAVAAVPREERIAVRGVRKHTAAAVTASAFTAPHVTEFLQMDVTDTMEALARLRELPEFAGLRVSPLLLVAKALLVAVARHPMINSSWDEDAQEIVVKHYVNLGIAAATERGLIVPNVKDAHALSLPGLARALGQLTETARAGKATPADLPGGTITITNVGVFGVDAGTPILTPGEAAILAFGQVKDAPWVHEGELAVRQVTTLSLSFDHRIVDGDLGLGGAARRRRDAGRPAADAGLGLTAVPRGSVNPERK